MPSRDRPNIVVITTDQQSAHMMSCAGNPYVRTPNMDRVAARGVRFERGYCTNPVCAPARVSWMTGLMPSALHAKCNPTVMAVEAIPPRIQDNCAGPLLARAGYDIAYGGKIHLPGNLHPRELGFTYLTGDSRDRLAVASADYIRADHDRPFLLMAHFINPHDICYMAIRDGQAGGGAAERRLIERGQTELAALDEALARPEGVSEAAFFADHCPPLLPNVEVQEDEPEAVAAIRQQRAFRMHAHTEWSDERWREHRWAYARLTERVDRQIGVLLDALEASGQAENTVVIFTSDHGDHNGAHRMEHKTTLYEEPLRVPLLVADPRGPSGEVDERHLVSSGLDLIPTLCDYAQTHTPGYLPGRSVRPLAEGRRPEDWRQELFLESEFGIGLHTGTHKFVRYFEGARNEQLYDLSADPYERRNFLHDDGREEQVADLRARLDEAREANEALNRYVREERVAAG